MLDHPSLRNRFKSIGVWDEQFNLPVFGWFPVLLGWQIDVRKVGPNPSVVETVPWQKSLIDIEIRFNGKEWDGRPIGHLVWDPGEQ